MAVDLKAGIVRVLKANGKTAGTGFVVSEDGLIATCSHVVQEEESQRQGEPRPEYVDLVFHATGDRCRARVEPGWWRPVDGEDVAILRLEGSLPQGATSLPLGSSVTAEGWTFFTFGFPDAKPVEGMGDECKVVGRTTENGFPVLQLRSTEIARGGSGAPVWDPVLGVVIGMAVSFINRPRSQAAFVIPIETLRDICPLLRLREGEPYRDLQFFDVEHAKFYFGRDTAARQLLDTLVSHDVVILVGASGSGKSSLVRAGLKKELHQHPIPGLAERVPCWVVPGNSPLLNLVSTLADHLLPIPDQLGKHRSLERAIGLPDGILGEDTHSLQVAANALKGRSPKALALALRALAPALGQLLIVDQFERIYTDCHDPAVRDHFVNTLLATAGDEVKIVLALRADFYGPAFAHPGLERIFLEGGEVPLGRMSEDELREIIEKPAWKLGRSFEPGLVERLISDVRDRAGDLPLLESALTDLWRQDNQKGVLTSKTYEELGYLSPDGRRFSGVRGSIVRRAEAVWNGLEESERRAARKVFIKLVMPRVVNEGQERTAEDASRRAWQAEWDETAAQVVEKLAAARLLIKGRDPLSRQPTVELAHEALIRAWPRFQRWVTEYYPFIHWYERDLAPFLHRWLEQGQHPDFLLPEVMLSQARHYLVRFSDGLGGPPGRYIQASVHSWEQKRAAAARLQRKVRAVALAGLLLIVAISVAFAWVQRNQMIEQNNLASTAVVAQSTADAGKREAQLSRARQLAFQAQMIQDTTGTGVVRRALLGAESLHWYPNSEGYQILGRCLDLLASPGGTISHKAAASALAFSPDSSCVVSGSDDGTVFVWEAQNGREVSRVIHGQRVTAVEFSPDGNWVASASEDGTARVWEAATGREITRTMHRDPVLTLDFRSDGLWIASGDSGGTVLVWETLSGERVTQMTHGQAVTAVEFSPDGRWIVSGSVDGTARVWVAATGQEVSRVTHDEPVTYVAFSPDGKWVGSAAGNSVRVWEASAAQTVTSIEHGTIVSAIVFSPDGRWLVSSDAGALFPDGITPLFSGMISVWEVETWQKVFEQEYTWGVATVAFSSDGLWLAFGSSDNTVRVWEVGTGTEVARLEHNDEVSSVAFSPNGRWLAAAGGDGKVQVWDWERKETMTAMEHEWEVADIAFSQDGQWLAAVGGETVSVWGTAIGFSGWMTHEGWVRAVDFSPDSQTLASASDDGTARVWRLPGGEELARLEHAGCVLTLRFSPNGHWLVSGSDDGAAVVWEASTGRQIAGPLQKGAVSTVDFSPDSNRVVSGSDDGTVLVWEAQNGREVSRMIHGQRVTAVEFGPNGDWVASASEDGTARVWEAATGREIAKTTHGGSVSTLDFSSDGQWIASGDSGGTVLVWETLSGERVTQMTHGQAVTAVEFSPDGRWIVSGSVDGTARVWVAATGQEVARVTRTEPVTDVAFSPDGKWVGSGSWDHTVQLWLWNAEDLIAETCSRLPRNLTNEEWQQYFGYEPYRSICPNLPVPEE